MKAADAIVPVFGFREEEPAKEIFAKFDSCALSLGRLSPSWKVHCPSNPRAANRKVDFLDTLKQGAFFTGANVVKPRRIEGIAVEQLFLDEISEMAPGLQAKLLHVLQDGCITRASSRRPETDTN